MNNGKKQNYELAFAHLKNKQNISAFNMFRELAQDQKESDIIKSGLFFILAGECRARQGKDNSNELLEAGNQFLKFAKKEKSYQSKEAYLCAAKCFLRVNKFDEAKKAFEQSQKIQLPESKEARPVVIVDDSKAVILKLRGFLKQLGFTKLHEFENGKDAITGCKKLIKNSDSPIVLLDMGLPDVNGDEVAKQILNEKLDLQIILITAEEKSNAKVNKTISSGVTAFIQKPFTIDDIQKAINTAESEFSYV